MSLMKFYLLALKGLAWLVLRRKRPEEARPILEKLSGLDRAVGRNSVLAYCAACGTDSSGGIREYPIPPYAGYAGCWPV